MLAFLSAIALAGVILARVSTGAWLTSEAASFSLALGVCALTMWAVWRGVQSGEPERLPDGLKWLLIAGLVIRLLAAILWFTALPVYGHHTPAEKAGYVMSDAYTRDLNAWKLARSGKPLLDSVGDYWASDQYGGLLLFSSAVYRYLDPQTHDPLLIVIFTAAFSALAVLFTYAFSRRAWGGRAAGLAAGLLALYPEAVLIGSSQMREAFTVTLAAAALYGLIHYAQSRGWKGPLWIGLSLLITLALTPPFTALLGLLLAFAAVGLWPQLSLGWSPRRRRVALLLAGLVGAILLIGLALSLRQFAPAKINNPVEVVSYWLRKSAEWNAHQSKAASGWVQQIFKQTPQIWHTPLLTVYGVLQPFLPAALIASSEAPIWPWIGAWRAIGWTLLLPFLLYAPVAALRRRDGDRLALMLSLAVWIVIIVASVRAGGDLWDNPRYRAAFAGPECALAAWVLARQLRAPDPWLRRVLVGVGIVLLWFIPWYLRRYSGLHWPVSDLYKTVLLGLATAVLVGIWDTVRSSQSLNETAQGLE
jgi:hypothetical protein